jgi:hypothetical protein
VAPCSRIIGGGVFAVTKVREFADVSREHAEPVKASAAAQKARHPSLNDADGTSTELVIDGSRRQKVITGYVLPTRKPSASTPSPCRPTRPTASRSSSARTR